MGWWDTLRTALLTAVGTIVTATAGAVMTGVLAFLSLPVLFAAIVVIAIVVTVILVDEFGFPTKEEEDFYNYAITDEFVYHASIHMHNLHYCSGAFIGTYFILTVAQCVYRYVNSQIEKSNMEVYVGENVVPSHSKYGYAVDKITLHPNFAAHRLAYNIAVLKLTEKVTQPLFVKPITLPGPTMHLEGTTVLVSGFRNSKVPERRTNMTKSEMKIIEYRICYSHFYTSLYTELKFCVIPNHRWKPCQTGRGGTAANNDQILIGLYVSDHPEGCAKNLPELFIDVSKYLEFIRSATN